MAQQSISVNSMFKKPEEKQCHSFSRKQNQKYL